VLGGRVYGVHSPNQIELLIQSLNLKQEKREIHQARQRLTARRDMRKGRGAIITTWSISCSFPVKGFET
jgi:hypothetical protein